MISSPQISIHVKDWCHEVRAHVNNFWVSTFKALGLVWVEYINSTVIVVYNHFFALKWSM